MPVGPSRLRDFFERGIMPASHRHLPFLFSRIRGLAVLDPMPSECSLLSNVSPWVLSSFFPLIAQIFPLRASKGRHERAGMPMLKRAIFVSVLCAGSPCLWAGDAGTTGANFLKLGIGPRAIAMGEAQVGLADDVYASYWNPAGLAGLRGQEAGFVQTRYVESIRESFAAYAYPTQAQGTFGVSMTYLGVGTFQGYDAVGTPTSQVGANDASIGLTYARNLYRDNRLGTRLSAGVTGKWIQERLDTVSARTNAADAGLVFAPGIRWGSFWSGWRAGLAVRNLGAPIRFDQDSFALPQTLAGGISYAGQWREESFTLALDGNHPNDGPNNLGAGLELSTLETFVLRAGYTSQGDLGNGLRFGAGVRFKVVQVDYAYAGLGPFGGVHRFGLTLRMGERQVDHTAEAQRIFERGMRKYKRKRFEEALVDFDKALKIDPALPRAAEMAKKTYQQIKTALPE